MLDKNCTQSQSFIHSFENLKNSKIWAASLVCSVLNGTELRDNCLAMQSCSSSSSSVFGDKQKQVELDQFCRSGKVTP